MVRISTQAVNNPAGLGSFLEVGDLVPQADGFFALPFPKGSQTFLSQRDGEGKFIAMDAVGTNELCSVDGSTVTFTIPEGCWTYAIVRGVRDL